MIRWRSRQACLHVYRLPPLREPSARRHTAMRAPRSCRAAEATLSVSRDSTPILPRCQSLFVAAAPFAAAHWRRYDMPRLSPPFTMIGARMKPACRARILPRSVVICCVTPRCEIEQHAHNAAALCRRAATLRSAGTRFAAISVRRHASAAPPKAEENLRSPAATEPLIACQMAQNAAAALRAQVPQYAALVRVMPARRFS